MGSYLVRWEIFWGQDDSGPIRFLPTVQKIDNPDGPAACFPLEEPGHAFCDWARKPDVEGPQFFKKKERS